MASSIPTRSVSLPSEPRPPSFWQVTWAFVLEPLDAERTYLHVRARAAFSRHERLHAAWIRPVHHFMQNAQLRHLRARVEGRLPPDDWRDMVEGVGGAAIMTAALLTPFLRGARSHWGVDEATAARVHPGDDLVREPRWGWTHGVEIEAPASAVWPWIAQIRADCGGFYSYQWLENVVGCGVRNAEAIHPDWEVRKGGHSRCTRRRLRCPSCPSRRGAPSWHMLRPIRVRAPGASAGRRRAGHSSSSRLASIAVALLSRYRCACSDDVARHLQFGPTLLEPIGFAMDRRMLMGVKERVEQATAPSAAGPRRGGDGHASHARTKCRIAAASRRSSARKSGCAIRDERLARAAEVRGRAG